MQNNIDENTETFGEYLRKLRGNRSLREMEKITGLSHTYLSTLEKGYDPRSKKKRNPTPEALKNISEKLDVNYMELMKKAGYLPQDDTNAKTIGEYIKNKRKEKGLSLRELARITGISHPYLSQLENGHNNNPSPSVLSSLAPVLDMPMYSNSTDLAEIINTQSLNFNGIELNYEDKQLLLKICDKMFK